jgi:hypothetical protein
MKMPALLVTTFALGSMGRAHSLPSGFAPGWNGQAVTPPMAWRSWNAFLAAIDDDLIRANIDAMVAKTTEGKSLWDVGFRSIGVDEGWEGCGKGVHGTQHDAKGDHASASSSADAADGQCFQLIAGAPAAPVTA